MILFTQLVTISLTWQRKLYLHGDQMSDDDLMFYIRLFSLFMFSLWWQSAA